MTLKAKYWHQIMPPEAESVLHNRKKENASLQKPNTGHKIRPRVSMAVEWK